jgi:hypothetical protein
MVGKQFWYLYWPDEKVQFEVVKPSKEDGYWFCEPVENEFGELPHEVLLHENDITFDDKISDIIGRSK